MIIVRDPGLDRINSLAAGAAHAMKRLLKRIIWMLYSSINDPLTIKKF